MCLGMCRHLYIRDIHCISRKCNGVAHTLAGGAISQRGGGMLMDLISMWLEPVMSNQ